MTCFARGAGAAESFGARPAAADVTASALKAQLTKPAGWGPSEWGPIPFLPSPDILVSRMERQWGALDEYRGINSTAKGIATGKSCTCTGVSSEFNHRRRCSHRSSDAVVPSTAGCDCIVL